MFQKAMIEKRDLPEFGEHQREIYLLDPDTDRTYIKIVGGVCPPNRMSPGYIVVAGMLHPAGAQTPHIWLMDEGAFSKTEDLLLAMSRCHLHYKVDNHYARFMRSKTDDRVYDDFLRHIQAFNREAYKERRAHIQIIDAPWTNDRGGLKFILEKMRDELRVGNRKLYWPEPSPASTRTLTGVDEWEKTDDKNTMLGALCYAVAGLLVDRPNFDRHGNIKTGSGVKKTVNKFDPLHTLNKRVRRK